MYLCIVSVCCSNILGYNVPLDITYRRGRSQQLVLTNPCKILRLNRPRLLCTLAITYTRVLNNWKVEISGGGGGLKNSRKANQWRVGNI